MRLIRVQAIRRVSSDDFEVVVADEKVGEPRSFIFHIARGDIPLGQAPHEFAEYTKYRSGHLVYRAVFAFDKAVVQGAGRKPRPSKGGEPKKVIRLQAIRRVSADDFEVVVAEEPAGATRSFTFHIARDTAQVQAPHKFAEHTKFRFRQLIYRALSAFDEALVDNLED